MLSHVRHRGASSKSAKKLESDTAEGQADVGEMEEAPNAPDAPNAPETPETPETDPNDPPPSKPPDPKPRWRSMIHMTLNRRKKPVLVDSGCDRTCMSYEYFKDNPYFKKSFKQHETSGKAINGSSVLSVGEVDLKFRLEGVHMQISCKVIKGLMDPIVLGWDWMYKYKAMLDPAYGKLHFMGGKISLLVENTHFLSGCFYRVFEDLVVPPNSKMHTEVELMVDKEFLNRATSTVLTEPFSNNGNDVWSCRLCSTVNDGKFMMELVNPCDYSVKLDAGHILGYADFASDDDVLGGAVQTEMACSYRGDDSAYESGEDTEFEDDKSDEDDEASEEIICDKPPPKVVPKEPPDNVPLSDSDLENPVCSHDSATYAHKVEEIPPGAKPLKIDYSTMAKDAEPYREKLQELLEVKHEKAFSKHDPHHL